MFPGKPLDPRRNPTLEFVLRMIITALHGEWDWTHKELVRIDVTKLFSPEPWMNYLNGGKTGRRELEYAALVLLETLRYSSARQQLTGLAADWIRSLIRKSLKYLPGPAQKLMSLQHQCRFVIRRNLRTPLYQNLESLPIPESLKKYVLMADELRPILDISAVLRNVKKNMGA
jgi:hypothetical protein